jgi:hypothetical protein
MPELPKSEKASHEKVHYEYPSEHMGQACGDCKHVIEQGTAPRCQTVVTPIFLTGWCVRFAAKKKK